MNIAVRDYLERLRPAEIREELKKNGAGMLTFYTVVLFPIFLWVDGDEYPQAILRYYLMIGAFLFIFLSARMHGLWMPKIMYLCPMSREERRAYLLRSRRVRIVMDLSVAAVPILLTYVLGLADLKGVVSTAISILFLVLCGSTRRYFVLSIDGTMTRYGETDGILPHIAYLVSYGTGYFSVMLDMGGTDGMETFLLLLGIELLLGLPLTLRVLRGRDAVIEEALDYESAYRITRRRV